MGWISRILSRHRKPEFICTICKTRIKDCERAAMILDRVTWEKSLVHKACLPARLRPAVFNPVLYGNR